MIRAVLIFLLLISSVWLGVQLHDDPGYVLIALNHWTIEATVWTTLLTLLIIFLVLHISFLSLSWVINLPHRWQKWLNQWRIRRAQRKHYVEKTRALKKNLANNKTPEGYLQLGLALEELNDTANACATYREGLRQALAAKNINPLP